MRDDRLVLRMLRRLTGFILEDAGFLHDTIVLSGVVVFLLLGHQMQAGVWALALRAMGAVSGLWDACYFALTSFTALGYEDLVLTRRYRVLGPLAAVNGVLMLGLTTSVLVAVVTRFLTITGTISGGGAQPSAARATGITSRAVPAAGRASRRGG